MFVIHIADGNDRLIELVEFRNEVPSHLPAHSDARERQLVVGQRTGQKPRRQNHGQPDGRCRRLGKPSTGNAVRHDTLPS